MAEISLKDRLKNIQSSLKNLYHIKKSDTAYWEARQIAAELKELFPASNNIRLDAKLLDDYSTKGSDKSKNEVIEDFKRETLHDILPFINSAKDTPDTTIE